MSHDEPPDLESIVVNRLFLKSIDAAALLMTSSHGS